MIVMIDNYDSFTYNLVQYFGELGEEIKVFRNDKITIAEIEALKPDRIVISPGPCYPSKAGVSLEVIKYFAGKLPILGVCLGHQCIGEAFGGKIVKAKKLMHGKTSVISHNGKGIFAGLKKNFTAVRYHSLVIDRESLPDSLEITAESDDGEIMGVKHKEYEIDGVQFHPESILTSQGKLLLANFLANKSLIAKAMTIRDAIGKVTNNQDLTEDEAAMVMQQIMNGEATSAQTSSFITAMRMKGEHPQEILGLVKTMREQSLKVHPKSTGLLDTCGTGGDALNTFNISTTAAFVACAAGAKIAKHGNRAASSKCGSADVLEALGIKIDLSPEQVALCIDEVGMGFMFAPIMHPAMKHAVMPRKEIGIRTFFNFIGPLTNPASCEYQIIGAFSDKVTELAANVLLALGSKKAMVVHGMVGLDEISTVGETKISEIIDGKVKTYYVKPEDFGLERRKVEEICIIEGDAKENAEILVSVLSGEKGAKRDIVLLNAAAALMVTGIAESILDGIAMCKKAIDSGAALEKLESLKKLSQEFA